MRDSTLTEPGAMPTRSFIGPVGPPDESQADFQKETGLSGPSGLQTYLDQHGRAMGIAVSYEDLLRFEGSVAILDGDDRDTLWVDCLYRKASATNW